MAISYDEWVERYRPIANAIDENGSFDGRMFETFGPELEFVQAAHAANPDTVWTLCEEDGDMFLSAGWRRVDRIGYFVTEMPAEQFMTIDMNGD